MYKAIQIKLVFFILLCGVGFSSLYAQNWNATISYTNDTLYQVSIGIPIIQYDSIQLYFLGDSLFQNEKPQLKKVATEFKNGNNHYVQFAPNFPAKVSNAFKFDIKDKRFLTYEVHLPSKVSFAPTAAVVKESGYTLVNWNNLLVLFSGFENDSLEIFWEQEGEVKSFGKNTFESWINNPTFSASFGKSGNNNKLGNSIYTNINLSNNESFFDLLGEGVFALSKLKTIEQQYSFIFLFDSLPERTGAMVKGKSAIFSFPTALLEDSNSLTLQKTFIHELFHLYRPNPWLGHVELSQWQEEALAEYIAVKSMLSAGLISDKDFLGVMEHKIRQSKAYANWDLNEAANKLQDDSYYNAYYSRGALIMWLIDRKIQRLSGERFEIEDLLMGNVPAKFLAASAGMITELFKEFALPNNAMNYNKFVPDWGILYESRRLEYFYDSEHTIFESFGKKLRLIETAELTFVEEGDVLLKVNKKKKPHRMIAFFHQPEEEAINCVIKRNNKKQKVVIPAQEQKVRIIIESLTKFPNQSEEQKSNWERYIN